MKSNHYHKLRRKIYKTTGNAVYYCTNGCTFKIGIEFSLGLESLCNKCNNPFKMNDYSIRAAKPICNDCIKRRTVKKDELGQEIALNKITSTEDDIKTRLSNLTIKEYNPDDEVEL